MDSDWLDLSVSRSKVLFFSCKIFIYFFGKKKCLGPIVQSIISLTNSLVVKMLTVLVSTISNSQVFLLKKCDSHFSAKILAFMPYLMIKVLTVC